LVALHLPFVTFVAVVGATGFGDGYGLALRAIPLAAVAGAIQIRHSLAAANGMRPTHWKWSLAALVLLAVSSHLMMPAWRSGVLHWFVAASFLMLLRPPYGLVLSTIDVLLITTWSTLTAVLRHTPVAATMWEFGYVFLILVAGVIGLYGAARLVWHAEELRASRAQLAELAGDHERLRISRNLHDLLGQSLSAVALKGDLAHGLLARREVSQASAEIASLVDVARSALRDVRTIAHREPAVSLASELHRGADILSAVGIDTRVDRHVEALPPKIDELFAWAVREGITNIVRHSAATACSISIGRSHGTVSLAIENDGAGLPSSAGHGLKGLVARAGELSGKASGQALAGGRFVLNVQVPEAASGMVGTA
jgi:two-component system sensor histidine kinase DesK